MVAVRGRLAHQTADDFADVAAAESTFIGAIPATKPARTINDVATVNGDPDVVEAAVRQALHRGLARTAELLPAVAYLAALRAGGAGEGRGAVQVGDLKKDAVLR